MKDTDALVEIGFDAEREFPEQQKYSHASVDYEHPSRHPERRCGNCEHFIPATPPRCEHVQSPILAMDWCRNWKRD